MWIIDKDTNQWISTTDKLETSNFQALEQDLESFRFYEKCLSGSTYVKMSNLDNIYDILNSYKYRTFNYAAGTYNVYIPASQSEVLISGSVSSDEFQNKFLPEYGLSLKNLFTPERLINDQINNLLYVDVSTTEQIYILGSYSPGLSIDRSEE